MPDTTAREDDSVAPMTNIVIIGGGPAGYEAALVAVAHGGDVTVVESDGIGGACGRRGVEVRFAAARHHLAMGEQGR